MCRSAKYIIVIAAFNTATQGVSAPGVAPSSHNTLPPFGHTVFCLKYPRDCERSGPTEPLADTAVRHAELESVNRRVNASIVPQPDEAAADDRWQVAPPEGNCHDYAVTKRHDLLRRGWPSSSLRLAEVTLSSGEHHLILVAYTESGEFILDNLDSEVLSLAQTKSGYYWNRIESADDPKLWDSTDIGHGKIRRFKPGLIPAT